MQHTFFQKLLLTVLAGALTAGFYVFFYEKVVVAADQSLNGAYKKVQPAAAHHR
ncbi:MAG: hypothetical protein PHQ12_09410 [Chthoniobacteraceae bacterium]|nr:hypothetical protein [Chthoniobacteraceae bacterium]